MSITHRIIENLTQNDLKEFARIFSNQQQYGNVVSASVYACNWTKQLMKYATLGNNVTVIADLVYDEKSMCHMKEQTTGDVVGITIFALEPVSEWCLSIYNLDSNFWDRDVLNGF